MSMNKYMKEVREKAANMNAELRADDPRLHGAVVARHQDGAFLFFEGAFFVTIPGPGVVTINSRTMEYADWCVIFTEHHGFHVYPWDEVRVWELVEKSE